MMIIFMMLLIYGYLIKMLQKIIWKYLYWDTSCNQYVWLISGKNQFQRDLSEWNVSNVIMVIFYNAGAFNILVVGISNVLDMGGMF